MRKEWGIVTANQIFQIFEIPFLFLVHVCAFSEEWDNLKQQQKKELPLTILPMPTLCLSLIAVTPTEE